MILNAKLDLLSELRAHEYDHVFYLNFYTTVDTLKIITSTFEWVKNIYFSIRLRHLIHERLSGTLANKLTDGMNIRVGKIMHDSVWRFGLMRVSLGNFVWILTKCRNVHPSWTHKRVEKHSFYRIKDVFGLTLILYNILSQIICTITSRNKIFIPRMLYYKVSS